MKARIISPLFMVVMLAVAVLVMCAALGCNPNAIVTDVADEPMVDPHWDAVESEGLINASFESGLDGWILTTDNTEGATYTSKDSRTGDKAFACWSLQQYVSDAYQKIRGISPGKYTLTAYVQSSGGQNSAYLYAHGTSQGRCMTAIPKSGALNDDEDGWVLITVHGIEVEEDGILTVGFYADAQKRQWINLDDLELHNEETSFPFLIGGDISQLTYVEDSGAKFYDADGNEADALQILAENGWNVVRLRLYNDPGKGRGDGTYYCLENYMNPEDILSLAKRASDKGMDVVLSLHYSDYWTNGGIQIIPTAWQAAIEGMDQADAVDTLEQLVYEFTFDFMDQMRAQGTLPAYVSLGNESQGGMLFPYGKNTVDAWPNLARFYAAGYRAVKEVSPDTQVIIHLDDAGDDWQYTTYFDSCKQYGAPFDIIGISYYPYYTERTVNEIKDFCNRMIQRYGCSIMCMETGYNWSPTRPNGWGGQLVDNGCYDGIYESSPEGQRDFMIDLFNALKNVDGGMCIGDLYWDPIFVEQEGVGWAYSEEWDVVDGNVVSNATQFDFEHRALPIQDAYRFSSNGADYAILSGKLVGTENSIPIANTDVTVQFGGQEYFTKTDACGGFILHTPAMSDEALSVSAGGLEYLAEQQIISTMLGTVTRCKLVMQGGSISGQVLDDSKRPVENVQVIAKGEAYELIAYTGADGRYTLTDLPAGSYTVSASIAGYRINTSPFAVEAAIGETVSDMNIDATLTSGTVVGSVVDTTGIPLAGAAISVWNEETTMKVYSDKNGSFRIPFVPAEMDYQVQVYLYTYEPVEVTAHVKTGQEADMGQFILVQALGTLKGTTIDRYGKPVSNALVMATNESGIEYKAMSAADGSFVMDSVLVGIYSISAAKTGLMSGNTSNVFVALGQIADAGLVIMPEPVALVNPGFESQGDGDSDADGWTITCTESGTNGPACFRQNRTTFGGALEGEFGLSIWLDQAFTTDAYQEVQGLAPGKYVFSAWIYSNISGDFSMYVKNAAGDLLAECKPGVSGNYVCATLEFEADGGNIFIGFATNTIGGDWAVIDQVELGMY